MTDGLVARSLTLGYSKGEPAVVTDLDLVVRPGELTLLFGSSGSGKTTLLSAFAGLLKPRAGTLHAWGQDVGALRGAALTAYRRRVGIVFQSFHLVASLHAWENVALPLQLNGMPARKARRRALDLLDELGVSAIADRRPDRLSGGQRQRIAIARALAPHPRLLLADEPTAHLDAVAANEIITLLHALVREDRAIVVATHDPRFTAGDASVLRLNPEQAPAQTAPPSRRQPAAQSTLSR